VVGVGDATQAGNVRHHVRKERETHGLDHDVVAAPGVGAVVHAEIELDRRELAVLVAGRTAIGVAGAAFSGEVLMLFICHGKGDRHPGHHGGGRGEAEVAGVGGPAEARTRGVHDDAQLFLGQADRIADAAFR
jgi:hypothetical protein